MGKVKKVDVRDEKAARSLDDLARLLNIPRSSDKSALLRTVCSVLEKKFSQNALKQKKNEMKNRKGTSSNSENIGFEDCPLGFSTGDVELDRACRILRLRYIGRLRDLQSRINRGLVEAQEITADPKTDSRLGKVGYGGPAGGRSRSQ